MSGDGASWSVSCPQAPRHVAFSLCVSASASTSIGARDSGITIHFEGEHAPESHTASQPRRHRPRTAPLVRRAYWPAKKCTCSAGRSPPGAARSTRAARTAHRGQVLTDERVDLTNSRAAICSSTPKRPFADTCTWAR